MSSEIMLSFLSNCSCEQKLGFRIVGQCAPVLKGIKASNLIRIQKGSNQAVSNYLKGTRVKCMKLCETEDKEMLFLYREEQLREHLKKAEVQAFLRKFEYTELTLEGVLKRLAERYAAYIRQKDHFPHELGVVLEYPVEDVEGFIEHQGQGCLMQRYWKVYHDCENAERLFRLYDEAKEQAMNEIVAGCPLCVVAAS